MAPTRPADLAVIALVDPPDDLVPAVLGDSDAVRGGKPRHGRRQPAGPGQHGDHRHRLGPGPASLDLGQPGRDRDQRHPDRRGDQPGQQWRAAVQRRGEVVGITSSIASLSTGTSAIGSIGLGFAIPVNLADRVAAEARGRRLGRARLLGIALSGEHGDGRRRHAPRHGRGSPQGSPAALAELAVGDVVVAIGNDPVNGARR